MPPNYVIPLTPGLILEGNYTLRLTALDPNTGNAVSGVKINNGALMGTDLNADQSEPTIVVPEPIFMPT